MKWARCWVTGLVMAGALAGCGAFIPTQHRIEVARKYMEAGNWRGAAVELRTVVQAHPKNAQAWLLLAKLSLDAGDPADAPADLNHALAAGAKGPDVDALRVRAWLETGHPKAALDALARHEVTLAGPEKSLAVARADLALRQPQKALTMLQPLVAAHPESTEGQVLLAEALAGTGDLAAALKQLDAAMAQDAKSPEPPLLKGRILASEGQYSAAERALTLALRRMPPTEPMTHRLTALVTLTEARLAQGEIDPASKSQKVLARLAPAAPVTRMLDARIKLAHGDLRDAIDELERVVADVPGYTEARMLLGGALLNRGDLEQAQEQLEQVVQEAPDNMGARRLLAAARLKLNEPEAALSALTPALSSQAADPQTLALLGATAVRLGNSPSALAELARDEQAHPGNETLRLNLAQAYLTTGDTGNALTLLQKTSDDRDVRRDALLIAALSAARGSVAAGEEVQKLIAAHPHDAGVLGLAGSWYASQGDFNRAPPLLSQAIRLDPNDRLAVIALARVQVTTGDLGAARKTLESALAADPKALPIRLALVDVLVNQKAFDQAVSLLNDIKPAQASPGVEFALARVRLAQGDLKQANAALDRAAAMRPGQAAIVEDAGSLLLSAQQYDAALARFAQATTLAPDNALYWLNAARAQLALNQPLAARTSLQKASKLRPNWLPVVGTLALMDLHRHDSEAALGRVKALVASEPHDAGALALEGDVEAATGNLAAAMSAYSEAQRRQPSAALAFKEFQVGQAAHAAQPQKPLEEWLAKQPDDTRIRTVLGNYYLRTNDLRAAAEAFQAVVRLAPTDVIALNNLAWIEDKLGARGAEALAERAHRLAPKSPNVDDTLGWILARRRQTARAVALLAEAVKLSPKDADMQYHYAYALVQDGKRAEARQILTTLISTGQKFDSRHEAQQLLAAVKT